MFFYPKSMKIGYQNAQLNHITDKNNKFYGYPLYTDDESSVSSQQNMPYSNQPMEPDQTDTMPMEPDGRRMPMSPDQRRMNGMPMGPDQRRRNQMPMGPDQRRMNGMPMGPDQRRMNGMPMYPDQRRMNQMPMYPDQRRMNQMPISPDQGMDKIPISPDQGMDKIPISPDQRLDGMPSDNFEQTNQGTLRDALEMIRDAIESEQKDELFYEDLIALAPDQEQKDIISSIRDDERKHYRYYRDIYREITGETIQPDIDDVEYEKPQSLLEGIERALFGELETTEKYRAIFTAMPNQYFRDIIFEIITDELKHGNKYNYLYTKNL